MLDWDGTLLWTYSPGLTAGGPPTISDIDDDCRPEIGVAFNTTLLALSMSLLLVLAQHMIQAFEERMLNEAGQYCLDNLINRLYEG